MTTSHYEPGLSMREARARYFADNGFGDDGGYAAAWVDFSLGPVPFPFPNTDARRRALELHDMHHVLTGYATDFGGELEISAWEIGAGCGDFWAAWFLNLAGLSAGLVLAPRRTLRAFVRGLDSRSLYGFARGERSAEGDRAPTAPRVAELLSSTVGALRARTGVDAPPRPASPREVAALAAAGVVGLALGLVFLAVGVVLAPVALAFGLVKRAAPRDRVSPPRARAA